MINEWKHTLPPDSSNVVASDAFDASSSELSRSIGVFAVVLSVVVVCLGGVDVDCCVTVESSSESVYCESDDRTIQSMEKSNDEEKADY